MPARPVLALLDGHSLAYRAFFALPEDLRTTTGQQTNAVYGFTSMLIKLLTEHRPDGIAVMFDKGRPAERLAILPEYKGTRRETPDAFRSQLPLIGEVLDALAIPQVTIDGVEADDLIATYATLAAGAGMESLVVTGDRDAFQLVDEHTSVLYTRRGISDTVVMDAAAIEAKYGVGPDRYPDLAALRGDPSDNIPGVPGIGEKTAAKLLAEYGDLEGIFANLEHIRGKRGEALAEHRQAVLDGYAVAQLRRDVEVPLPIDALRRGDTDMEGVRRLFATLEFRALWERLTEALDAGAAETEAGSFAVEPRRLGAGELVTWLGGVSADMPVALVPFTRGRPPAVTWEAVAVAATGAAPATATLDELAREDLDALAGLLAAEDRPLLVHGLKALCHAAASRGWPVAGVQMDTELAAYLVQPQQRAYDLEALALQYLNKQLTAGAPTDEGSQQLAMAMADDWPERGLRAQALHEIADVLAGALAERDQARLLGELELPLVAVLVGMEHAGVAVDLEVLAEIGETLGDRMRGLREEIYGWADEEFNLDSPKQLQAVLFDRLDLPKTKRIKTGYSTDAAALTAMVDTHPIVAPLLEYREVSKLKGTYVDALPPLVDPATGRIHAEFRQTVAVTGRLSSQHPNIQNIPIRSVTGREIRRAFVPGEGYTSLLLADYSQIELRVMAHLSGDEDLIAAFASHEDIHATTAALVWDLPISAVDNALRSRIKGMTYGLAYGLSAFGLSQQLGIPPDEARELMEAYFARFPGVRDYLHRGVEQARKDGWTSTLFGRRRYLPDLMSDNRQRREMAERMALNAPIQGTAADIIKMAMVTVHERMAAAGMGSQLLLQVHDELVCETAPGEEEPLRELLVDAMSGVADLAVALEVDTASGRSWAEAEKH